MYGRILQLSFVLSLSGLGISAFQLMSQSRTGLCVEPEVIDFGTLNQGAILDANFRIVNRTDGAIRLDAISSRCDCLTAEVPLKDLPAGSFVPVESRWKIGDRRGFASTQIEVLATTSTGKSERRSVELRANVIADVEYSPVRLIFGASDALEQTIKFVSTQQSEGRLLLDATSSHKAFEPAVRAERDEIVVRFRPELWKENSTYAELTVRTSSSIEPRIVIGLIIDKLPESSATDVDP